jgi:arylsulfatase A-like enzyme
VLPTICDYAGVQAPAVVRGQSLRTVIEKPDEPGHEYVVSEMARGEKTGRSFMVRTKNYKYMVFPGSDQQPAEMLFDMQSDPGEMKNLAAEPSLAKELQRHRELLAQWRTTTEEAKHPVGKNAEGRKAKRKS